MRYRVLVVEADEDIRTKTEAVLRVNYEVQTAHSGEIALEKLSVDACDVVITDVPMPGKLNGLQLLHECRRRFPSTRVILHSSFNDLSLAVDAMRSGAFHFVTRPCDWTLLAELVRMAAVASESVPEDLLRCENLRLREEIVTLKRRLREPVNFIERRRTNGGDRRQSGTDRRLERQGEPVAS